MQKTELVHAIADRADLTKAEAGEALNALLDAVTDALCRNDTVNLIGFGSFSVRQRAAREGRNPQTGEAMQIPASQTAAFRPGKGLKDAVN